MAENDFPKLPATWADETPCERNDGGAHIPTSNEHGDAWCSLCGERLLIPGFAGGPAEIIVPAEGRPTDATDSSALLGMDGNAFAVIGNTKGLLRRAGASREFQAAYVAEAMSGDYDHVLATSAAYLDCNGGDSQLFDRAVES